MRQNSDRTRQRRTCDVLAEAFAAAGVHTLFGLFGDGNLTFMAAMESRPDTRVIQSRHEAAAVFMAAGYARATGRPALATVTAGPGLAHTLTPLVSACRARLPLVVYAGDTPVSGRSIGGLQEFDHHAFAELAGATHVRVDDRAHAASCVADAVRLAVLHQRPVVLSVPEDLMESPSAAPTGDLAPHNAPEQADEPAATPRPNPSPTDVAVAAEIFAALSSARAPMLVAGSGAVALDVLPQLRSLARLFGATLATTFRAKGSFDGEAGNLGIVGPLAHVPHQRLQEQADLVVGVGADLHGFGAYVDDLIGCRTICLGAERHGGVPASHTCGREASIAVVLELLREHARRSGRADRGPVGPAIADRQQAIAADLAELPELVDPELVDPRRLMLELDDLLPPDCIVVIGGGHFWSWPLMYLSKRNRDFVFPIEFGSIGMALPTGIGISAAGTARDVVVIEGDGGVVAGIQEIESAARHRIPVTIVVVNDAALGAEFHKLAARGLPPDPSRYEAVRFGEVAAAFGAYGATVRSTSDLAHAYHAPTGASPVQVLDVRVSPEITSRWYRRLHSAGRGHAEDTAAEPT